MEMKNPIWKPACENWALPPGLCWATAGGAGETQLTLMKLIINVDNDGNVSDKKVDSKLGGDGYLATE